MFTFDEEKHEYRFNGQIVPHVTGVLKDMTDYSMVPPAKLEAARQKGVAVHKMVELWAKNELDYETLPEWQIPVLEFWLHFVADTHLEIIDSEKKCYHETYRLAGTRDLKCRMPKAKERRFREPGILDIKRSFFAGAAIGLQLAGYEILDEQKNIAWRGALRLHEDHPYKFMEFQDRNDRNVFLACLTRHNWIRSHQ